MAPAEPVGKHFYPYTTRWSIFAAQRTPTRFVIKKFQLGQA
jgi:hypothetical protein